MAAFSGASSEEVSVPACSPSCLPSKYPSLLSNNESPALPAPFNATPKILTALIRDSSKRLAAFVHFSADSEDFLSTGGIT